LRGLRASHQQQQQNALQQCTTPSPVWFSGDLRHNRFRHRASGAKKCTLAEKRRQHAAAFLVDKKRFGEIDDQRAVASNGGGLPAALLQFLGPVAHQLPFHQERQSLRAIVHRDP